VKGVIAAGDLGTAKAGEYALKQGGNAYDAAIAAMLAAPLCEPVFTSLGGGGFMLTCAPDAPEMLYDFFVDVPPQPKGDPEFFPVYVDFKTAVQEFHIGCGSAAVPGMVAGIWRLHQDKATLPLEVLIRPAVQYAREGLFLSPVQASFIRLLEPIFTSTPEIRALYMRDNQLIDAQHRFKNPPYADFLERFAKEGAALFYEGEVAKGLVELCAQNGGLINQAALEEYCVHVREPLRFAFDGYEVATNPPPSSGGMLIAFTLKLLEQQSLGAFGSKAHVLNLAEALHVTADFRKEHVDRAIHDPALIKVFERAKLFENYALSLKSRLNLWGNTTHISVMDEAGNGASVTTTNGEACGHVIPNTGILLNNMLGEEDLNPHGFFGWPKGVRLPSMMAPTALSQKGKPKMVLGSAGSNRIRSAIVGTLLNTLRFEKSVQEAIDAPRLHVEKKELFLEPAFCLDPSFLEARYALHVFHEKNLYFGGVQAATASLEGGADPRRGAAVLRVE
jgi:gamma-glutamyltranspeptidase/glutathione hydrolase